MFDQQLLTKNNAKTIKGEPLGYRTYVLSLAPGDLSGHEVCFWRTPECFSACLYFAGHGQTGYVKRARIKKTKRYFLDKKRFIKDLCFEINHTSQNSLKRGIIPTYRLDCTSDLGLAQKIAPLFPELQFYDYTKNFKRKGLDNWDITYSFDGLNWNLCKTKLLNGTNVAVIFRDKKLPLTFRGFPVLNGDFHDLRFLDKKGYIVGLSVKGAKKKLVHVKKFFVDKETLRVHSKVA